jgi:hypothetical protein
MLFFLILSNSYSTSSIFFLKSTIEFVGPICEFYKSNGKFEKELDKR